MNVWKVGNKSFLSQKGSNKLQNLIFSEFKKMSWIEAIWVACYNLHSVKVKLVSVIEVWKKIAALDFKAP